ncbi:hypothetical protein PG997_014816 [Apiospora hydei]|uniref:Uncharacterized protein n=1 Tax=Apiospora hydei TaxID=1337664 RepID=A0ABR1UY34_9PEZI
MKSSIFALLAASAQLISASPMDTSTAVKSRRDSGCWNVASPRCCLPNVCVCRGDSGIYQLNRDKLAQGGDACDPPWGYIGEGRSSFPGYCCREAPDGTLVEIATGEIVE